MIDSKHQQISKEQRIKQKEMGPTRYLQDSPFLVSIIHIMTIHRKKELICQKPTKDA